MCTHSLIPVIGLGTRLVHKQNRKLTSRQCTQLAQFLPIVVGHCIQLRTYSYTSENWFHKGRHEEWLALHYILAGNATNNYITKQSMPFQVLGCGYTWSNYS